MTTITLVCAAGMSTSMLMSRMRTAATALGADLTIEAIAEADLRDGTHNPDVLLLGPQVAFLESDIRRQFGATIDHIAVIPPFDYGMMNGEKVLRDALAMMGDNNE